MGERGKFGIDVTPGERRLADLHETRRHVPRAADGVTERGEQLVVVVPVVAHPGASHGQPSTVARSNRPATAGFRRSASRHRWRLGPMLPTGMPSLAPISL